MLLPTLCGVSDGLFQRTEIDPNLSGLHVKYPRLDHFVRVLPVSNVIGRLRESPGFLFLLFHRLNADHSGHTAPDVSCDPVLL